ncbi:MAG: hypothetical protein JWP87_2706 [Labilithrix sp.]|nr:hypothetical protein [Labilithrix sp.]
MQGSKKPPTSEVLQASASDRRERNTSPPSAIRRDDRAEPDDDEVSSSRIDVVNVEVGRGDTAASGMLTLRRELAKLHQQAAAVEKSLEDQRRERSDSLDRLERATERALTLEAEVTSLEKMHESSLAELQTVRAERDDLRRAVEAAKASASELGSLKDELAALRSRAEDTSRQDSTELAKAKEEVAEALAQAKQAKADADKARKALDVAEGDAAMVSEQASKIRAEAEKVRMEAERQREELTKARDEATNARDEATKARDESAKRAAELAKVREDLTRAKDDNARDRATARDRIDLLDRALDDARAATARTESELEAARSNEERIGRQLEAALARASQAESAARSAEMAHAALENSLRILRDEISGAFSRVGQHGMPPPLPRSLERVSRMSEGPVYSVPPDMILSERPDPIPASVPPADVAEGTSENATDAQATQEARPKSSAPPPQGTIPPPMYASVPPQIHESSPPETAQTAPPPAPPSAPASVPAPRLAGSVPPPRGSTRPESLPPADGWSDSVPPPTRRPGSAMPPPYHEAADLTSKARQELLAKLVDPDNAHEAAAELKQHPEWLRSVPPPALIAALSSIDYDAEGTLFDLARAWDREPLCHSIITALRSEKDPRAREHSAWLLKHLAAPSSWKAIADLARSDEEPAHVRRWLLEALDRLAAGRAIGWRELGDVVTSVARHPDATLRDGVVGILVSLDRSDEKRRLLLDILRADDDEVVLASAVNALASVLPMELDPGLVERLLGHPSPRVQRSVRDLIERAKHTKS